MHTTSAVFVAIAGAVVTVAANAPPQITPFADHPRPRINAYIQAPALNPTNALESACFYTSYPALLDAGPEVTNSDLADWMYETAEKDMKTITALSEVDEMCITTDDFTPPATLASAYSDLLAEFSSWRIQTHDEVAKIAEKCGNTGPMFMVQVATDVNECRSAVSALFGATATGVGAGAGATPTGEKTGSGSGVKETGAANAGGEPNVKGSESSAVSYGVTGQFVGAVVVLACVSGLFVGL
ncbi:hypothetical protein V8F20_009219 [Naviculisporaceae sp. PSN 640]